MVPGQSAIVTFSPPLEGKGNSVRIIKVFEELSKRHRLRYFESVFRGNMSGRDVQGLVDE